MLKFLRAAGLCLLLAISFAVQAEEPLPARPAHYFNDYAGVVSADTASQLDQKLQAFEQSDSSQVVVAVYPHMESKSSLEDYTHRIFQSWQIGQKGKNNGILLLVFVNDHRMRIEVGYGLEGALPDAVAKRIIDEQIAPQFRAGDFNRGLGAGVNAIIQATRGEYKSGSATQNSWLGIVVGIIFLLILVFVIYQVAKSVLSSLGTGYSRSGRYRYRRRSSGWDWWGGWGDGGGSSGGGGGWSSGGGGFSGGGGSSGGGGASGSW